jgi:hypothetical protein
MFNRSSSLSLVRLVLLAAPLWAEPPPAARPVKWPVEVEAALAQSGRNRPELERVLRHYRDGRDPQKFEAACFLVRNMPGHGYVSYVLADLKGMPVPFDPLAYPNFDAAKKAADDLERKHGPLDFRPARVLRDLETITAAYLIEDIDLAFRAWREKPWARNLSLNAFCEYVLPYRAGREPIERWRAACELPTASVRTGMKDEHDPHEAAVRIAKMNPHRMSFDPLYYLHPTDQGFAEMCRKPVGRCGDMVNLQVYVYRANAVAVAGDYTPFWAHRDNNHAWEVVLDREGRGWVPIALAAKIYRKTFSHNPETVAALANQNKDLPPALKPATMLDVTDQYLPTTDVTLSLEYPPPRAASFAYICVFNGGEWRPIHFGRIRSGRTTFTKMGRKIAYLAAYYQDQKVVPAAVPFIVDEAGHVVRLDLPAATVKAVRDHSGADEKKSELFVWEQGWRPLGRLAETQKAPQFVQDLPAGCLYWIASDNDRQTARIFTMEAGRQRFW